MIGAWFFWPPGDVAPWRTTTRTPHSSGSGQFKKDPDLAFRSDDKVVTTDIQDREGILPSIKSFLGKGR